MQERRFDPSRLVGEEQELEQANHARHDGGVDEGPQESGLISCFRSQEERHRIQAGASDEHHERPERFAFFRSPRDRETGDTDEGEPHGKGAY